MNRNTGMNAGQIIGTLGGLQVIGLDIAKQVFQLHTVDMDTGEISNIQIKRAKLMEYFANRKPSLITMEACGGAHHWARKFSAIGHTVALVHAKSVRPFVQGNKTDAADARAIWQAVQQPKAKLVGIKTTEQQAALTLHRQREQLKKMRTMQSNELRGLLYEFGAIFSKGRQALFKDLEASLDSLQDQLPQMVADSLREQLERIRSLGTDMQTIEQRLALVLKANSDMQRISSIPGVGLLTATAAIATMGNASAFKSGRQFCAWLGLVPSQKGTGGKVHLGAISKRGDTYLRTLLIHGARSVIAHTKQPGHWLAGIKGRRPASVVIVAQAAKTARLIWALTAKQQNYQQGFQSVRPLAAMQGL